jgi:hypothetical protein
MNFWTGTGPFLGLEAAGACPRFQEFCFECYLNAFFVLMSTAEGAT